MTDMEIVTMKLSVLLLALLMAGCSAHHTRVDCEGKLKPINALAPVATSAATPTGSMP